MNLTIDIGNTLQKIAVFNNDECVYCQSFPLVTEAVLLSVFQQFSIKNSIVSSVAELDQKVIDFLNKKTQPTHYSHQTKLPIIILYKSKKTLGLDRIANAVGAAAIFPDKNILSIQAGTCLVFDFVNENKEYLGGSISPGIQMRFETLHEKTKNLPLLKITENHPGFLGSDTDSSINSGIINGICYEIDGFIDDYKAKFNNVVVLLTGGDAVYLQNSIKNTIFAVPNLVLKGLNEIIKYNV
jgi:type III pantothenate kinase